MFNVLISFPAEEVINFEIENKNPKKSGQSFKYLKKEKIFQGDIKSSSHPF